MASRTPGFLGDRHDLFEEVLQVVPELLLGDDAGLGQGGVLHQLVVEADDHGAAAPGGGHRRAGPVEHRHPLRAPDRNAEPAHVADQLAGVLDLLVPVRQAELGLVERWAGLDDVEGEAAVVERRLHPHEVGIAPGPLLGVNVGGVPWDGEAADHVVDAALLDHPPERGRVIGKDFGDLDHLVSPRVLVSVNVPEKGKAAGAHRPVGRMAGVIPRPGTGPPPSGAPSGRQPISPPPPNRPAE